MEFEIRVWSREVSKKSTVNQLRREGKVPVVIYGSSTSETGYILKSDFETVLRNLPSGFLPTAQFVLVDESGNKRKAIIKDVQYHITTYNVMHVDFQQLKDDVLVKVKVPIRCTNAMECVGVKAGGFLRYVMRTVTVTCPSDKIPTHFDLDVKNLEIGQVKRIEDLALTESVRPKANKRETLVIVAKR